MKQYLYILIPFITLLVATPSLRLSARSADSLLYVNSITIEGNTLTKEKIVLREIPFQRGDTLEVEKLPRLLRKCSENLNNTGLFNYIDVKEQINGSLLDVKIIVEERWYVWPLLGLNLEDRNLSSWIKKADLNRMSYELGVKVYNVFGLKHKLSASFQLGYRQQFNLRYDNICLDKEGKILLGFALKGKHTHRLDLATINDDVLNYREGDKYLYKELSWAVFYKYRPSIRMNHTVSLKAEYISIDSSVLVQNPNYWGSMDTKRTALCLNYEFVDDQRDYHRYPLRGLYASVGLDTYFALNAPVRWARIDAAYQYYYPINKRWNISTSIHASWAYTNYNAWILNHAIGYEGYLVRGYDFHVSDAQACFVNANTLKYNILPKKIFVLGFLGRFPKINKPHLSIYGNVHFDTAYGWNKYHSNLNPLENRFLYAAGAGLDFITYYDIVLGIRYNINREGEHGFCYSLGVTF